MNMEIEAVFESLRPEERETIIRHGVALRLSVLQKRLFLAERKVREFEEKYGTTLARLEAEGLPDAAGYEMHEDYIMCRHWDQVAGQVRQDIQAMQEIAQRGL
jgi:hypothetical protein